MKCKFSKEFAREFRKGQTEIGAGRDRALVDDCVAHTGVIIGEDAQDGMFDELAYSSTAGTELTPTRN